MYKEGKRKAVVLVWGVIPNDLNTSRQSPPLEGSTTSQSSLGKRGLTIHVPVTHRHPSHSRGVNVFVIPSVLAMELYFPIYLGFLQRNGFSEVDLPSFDISYV